MKAAICYEFGKPLVIEDVEIEAPKKDEVKVRLVATAICHSDIHLIRGEMGHDIPLPLVAGHECAGYVEEIGDSVQSVKAGDPVIASLIKYCGKCRYCISGLPHLCEYQFSLESVKHLRNSKGQRLGCIAGMSGFVEQTIVHESQVIAVPKDMPLDRAALLACGVITGLGAVINRAQVTPNSSVVVIGTGGVGLNAIQGASISGAYPIIAVDIFDNKLKTARDFGATHTVNSKHEDAIKVILELTSGRGAEYVFITVGNTNAIKQGFEISGCRGMTVIVGMATGTISINPNDFVVPGKAERVLTGCGMGSTNPKIQIPKLVALYQSGRLKLDELITGRYPLKNINEAIAEVEKGQAIRNVIMFQS